MTTRSRVPPEDGLYRLGLWWANPEDGLPDPYDEAGLPGPEDGLPGPEDGLPDLYDEAGLPHPEADLPPAEE